METRRFNLTAYIAAAVARKAACAKRADAYFLLNRAACHAAARQSALYNHPEITRGRAERILLARRALGVILTCEKDDVLRILRAGYRDICQRVSSTETVDLYTCVSTSVSVTDNQAFDRLVVALAAASVMEKPIPPTESNARAQSFLIDYDGQAARKKLRSSAQNLPLSGAAKALSRGIRLPGTDGLTDFFGEGAYAPEQMLSETMGISISDLVDGLFLSASDLSAVSLASDGHEDTLRRLALWALALKAVSADRDFCLDRYRDDQEAQTEQAQAEAATERKKAEYEKTRAEQAISESDALRRQFAEYQSLPALAEHDRQEIAALRAALFQSAAQESEEQVPETQRILPARVLSVGGSDTWLFEMRRAFPNVKFLSPDQSVADAEIRAASEVWFQASYIGHSQFYRVVSLCRAENIPVRYYSGSGVSRSKRDLLEQP